MVEQGRACISFLHAFAMSFGFRSPASFSARLFIIPPVLLRSIWLQRPVPAVLCHLALLKGIRLLYGARAYNDCLHISLTYGCEFKSNFEIAAEIRKRFKTHSNFPAFSMATFEDGLYRRAQAHAHSIWLL